jgi:hypothetical protein
VPAAFSTIKGKNNNILKKKEFQPTVKFMAEDTYSVFSTPKLSANPIPKKPGGEKK